MDQNWKGLFAESWTVEWIHEDAAGNETMRLKEFESEQEARTFVACVLIPDCTESITLSLDGEEVETWF